MQADAAVAAGAGAATVDEVLARGERLLERAEFVASDEAYREALATGESTGDRAAAARAYRGLAELYGTLGDWQQAMEHLQRAREIHMRDDDRVGLANDFMALVWWMPGPANLRQAESQFHGILARSGEDAVRAEVARSWAGLGHVLLKRQEHAEAEDMFRRALRVDEALGDPLSAAIQETAMGLTHAARGDMARAVALIEEGIARHEQTEDRKHLDYHYAALRNACLGHDDERALAEGRRLCSLLEAFEVLVAMPEARVGVARVLQSLRRFPEAEGELIESLDLATQAGMTKQVIEAHVHLAALYIEVERTDLAEDEFGDVLRICQHRQDRMGEAQTLVELGNLRAHAKDSRGATGYWTRAQMLFWTLGRADLVKRVDETQAKVGP